MINIRNRSLIVAIAVIVVLLLAGAGFWYWETNQPVSRVACTMEAKLCPDGSYVGRTGPNCEFATCSSVNCSKEGKAIGAQGLPPSCCSGLKAIGGWPGGYSGNCSVPPPPSGLLLCAACGNGICDVNNGENKCNCPNDCVDTSTWQIYRNEKYGFEVKYPEEFGAPYEQFGSISIGHGEGWIVHITPITLRGETPEQIISLRMKEGGLWHEVAKTKIGGTEARTFEVASEGGVDSEILFLVHGNYIYEIESNTEPDADLVRQEQQILSTFKFISTPNAN